MFNFEKSTGIVGMMRRAAGLEQEGSIEEEAGGPGSGRRPEKGLTDQELDDQEEEGKKEFRKRRKDGFFTDEELDDQENEKDTEREPREYVKTYDKPKRFERNQPVKYRGRGYFINTVNRDGTYELWSGYGENAPIDRIPHKDIEPRGYRK